MFGTVNVREHTDDKREHYMIILAQTVRTTKETLFLHLDLCLNFTPTTDRTEISGG